MQSLRRKLVDRISLKQSIGCRTYSTKKVFDVGQPTAASHPQLLEEGEVTPGITSNEYISRRKRLLELLPEKSLAIIAAAPIKMMTDVVPYTYRQDADYLYITGCQQPGGIAVLGHECGLCMFMPESDPQDVIWQGNIAGVDAALDTFKADQAFPMRKMRAILPDMIGKSSKLFHNVKTAVPTYLDLEAFRKAAYNGKAKDLSIYTHELRWIKSPAEIKLMRESASIACQALLQTMLLSKSLPNEGMLSAKVEYECKMRGAQRMAFNPVVGGGPNGSVIHYSRNDQKIKDGYLVLMDVGCELHGYLSDLTRTWPPSGSFSSTQEELYALILETNKECMMLCRPGTSIRQIHNYSVELLHKGLKEIGILKDDRSNSQSYHQLNPTSIGHYLGMDVHDCSMVSSDRPLKPGVVITIEPGIYIPSSFDGPERYRGIGIRIEDDVLITETGHEVLTGSMPKEVQHIESLLNNYSRGLGMETHNNMKAASRGLSVEGLPPAVSNMPDCTAFCNHSKNSSSVMLSSKLDAGIPPLCPKPVPFTLLCLEGDSPILLAASEDLFNFLPLILKTSDEARDFVVGGQKHILIETYGKSVRDLLLTATAVPQSPLSIIGNDGDGVEKGLVHPAEYGVLAANSSLSSNVGLMKVDVNDDQEEDGMAVAAIEISRLTFIVESACSKQAMSGYGTKNEPCSREGKCA
ncbi:hypothetical protein HHK36_020921 [Tetracentron sinense]|uniref:Aminopeptidase P N-terminal domain-containing protein n=1 Tax=Tetracentron sinense TaxID=13715 RepID=A0A834YSF1_TETSI|nr:hypothetical protein HHK36_020921 [Tetracentron sinense]